MDNSWKVGQVKFFNADAGYGFITSWDDHENYFAHISGVVTKPIAESDQVIFKLSISRKKPGTLEARNVHLLSQFKEDTAYLTEQFLKYGPDEKTRILRLFEKRNELFRSSVLQILSEPEIIRLLETEIVGLRKIENDRDLVQVEKLFSLYLSVEVAKASSNRISELISTWVQQNASDKYLTKFWLKGVYPNQPDSNLLEEYFENTDRRGRVDVFNKSDDLFKDLLITKYISEDRSVELLDIILDYLRVINGIRSSSEIRFNLFDSNFWKDKKGIELYRLVVRKVLDASNDSQKFELFIDGYSNEISSDYVVSNIGEIGRTKMERVLERGQLSQDTLVKVFDSYLRSLHSYYWNMTPKPSSANYFSDLLPPDFRHIDTLLEPIIWTIDWAKKCLAKTEFETIEMELVNAIPGWLNIRLWEEGRIESVPLEKLSKFLLATKDVQSKVELWLNANRIQLTQIVEIVSKNLVSFFQVNDRRKCSTMFAHLSVLKSFDYDIASIEENIPKENLVFYRLFLWLEGLTDEFNFEEFKTKVVFLNPDGQIRFLKKLFWLAHTKQFNLTVEKLDQLTRVDFDIYETNERENPDVPIDISLDIAIETIKSFAENQRFLRGGELLKIALKHLTGNRKHRFQVKGLFEKCAGRYQGHFYWTNFGSIKKVPFGQDNFYYSIEFEANDRTNDLAGQIPGSRWNESRQHWGVPKQYEEDVLKFGREHRLFFDFEGSNYANNTHLAVFGREDVPYGITYCEGRKANVLHRTFNREFWMCSNQACFNNCETIHEQASWLDYTLLDFLLILGYDLGEVDSVGGHIEKGKYYKFISTINWFNLLSERLCCKECQHVLHPIEPSYFARHFVVNFRCENSQCTEHGKKIYLNQCLNGKRKGIVDSRQSKKCPNGMYVCSDKNCGCCCSHKKFEERLERLQIADNADTPANQRVIADLRFKIENRLGHLERAMHYCFHCGSLMDEMPNDVFKCPNCTVNYEVAENRFERPHRHVR